MQFTMSKIVEAPTDRVWRVVAHEFADVGSWSSAVAESRAADLAGPDGAPVGGRLCTTPGFGELAESIVRYSEAKKELTYGVSGLPSFITRARTSTSVRPGGVGRSEITFSSTIETSGIGRVMGPMFRIKIRSTISTMLDELATYIECGELSRKKVRQLAKAAG